MTELTVKLASIKYYDELPTTGDETGRAFRDIDLENKLLEEAHKIGLGAPKSIMRSMRHLPHIYYGYRYHDTAAGR